MRRFEWDEHNVAHIARHDVVPSEVEDVFYDDPIELGAYSRRGELRQAIVGSTDAGRVIWASYTVTPGGIRPVTAFESRKYRHLFR